MTEMSFLGELSQTCFYRYYYDVMNLVYNILMEQQCLLQNTQMVVSLCVCIGCMNRGEVLQ